MVPRSRTHARLTGQKAEGEGSSWAGVNAHGLKETSGGQRKRWGKRKTHAGRRANHTLLTGERPPPFLTRLAKAWPAGETLYPPTPLPNVAHPRPTSPTDTPAPALYTRTGQRPEGPDGRPRTRRDRPKARTATRGCISPQPAVPLPGCRATHNAHGNKRHQDARVRRVGLYSSSGKISWGQQSGGCPPFSCWCGGGRQSTVTRRRLIARPHHGKRQQGWRQRRRRHKNDKPRQPLPAPQPSRKRRFPQEARSATREKTTALALRRPRRPHTEDATTKLSEARGKRGPGGEQCTGRAQHSRPPAMNTVKSPPAVEAHTHADGITSPPSVVRTSAPPRRRRRPAGWPPMPTVGGDASGRRHAAAIRPRQRRRHHRRPSRPSQGRP